MEPVATTETTALKTMCVMGLVHAREPLTDAQVAPHAPRAIPKTEVGAFRITRTMEPVATMATMEPITTSVTALAPAQEHPMDAQVAPHVLPAIPRMEAVVFRITRRVEPVVTMAIMEQITTSVTALAPAQEHPMDAQVAPHVLPATPRMEADALPITPTMERDATTETTVLKMISATDQGPALAHPMDAQEAPHAPPATAKTAAAA